MKLTAVASKSAAPCCQHLSSKGRRCRQPACPTHPSLCFTHAPKPEPPPSPTEELVKAAGALSSPEDVRRLLVQTLLALAQDRISTKKAGTLGYLCQMLLRTHREIVFHNKVEAEAEAEAANPVAQWPNFPSAVAERTRANLEAQLAQLNEQLGPRDSSRDSAPPPAAATPPTVPSSTQAPTLLNAAPSNQGQSSVSPTAASAANNPAPPNSPSPHDEAPPPRRDLRHFYPWDPCLHPSLIGADPSTNIPPRQEPHFIVKRRFR